MTRTEAAPQAITRKSENFAEWYTDVVRKAELADYSPVRGCMIIRPYGYALWENVQRALGCSAAGWTGGTSHGRCFWYQCGTKVTCS